MISEVKIQLRYVDTDQMGVIHHSKYFAYFELGRISFLKDFGFDYYGLEARGVMTPIRDVGCTYLKSIKAEEEITVYTSISSYTKLQIHFYHEIRNSHGELKCTGHTHVVFVDKDSFKLIKMEDRIPDFYEKLKQIKISNQ